MAQIALKIQVNENAGTSLDFNSASEINNVSSPTTIKTTENDGVNGISFASGSVSLANGFVGNGAQFQSEKEKYNGYMFGATDENGNFSLKLTLTGENLDRIVVHFDKNANQFAKEAIIDGNKLVENDDLVWDINLGQELSSHTIEFTKWNRPNYNACFTLIQVMLEYLELNKNWITGINSISQSVTNAENIEYGMLANTGSAEVFDIDGRLGDLINDEILNPSSVPVQVFVNGNLIQKHITTSSTYDIDSRMLSISFSNELENFSKLKYKGYVYPDESRTAYEMLYDVMNSYYGGLLSLSDFDEMLSEKCVYGNDNTYGTIYDYLKKINIQYPYIEANKTYAEVINSFCTLAQLNFIAKDNGKFKFLSARPAVGEESYINIPINAQMSAFSGDLILKNKFDGVEVSELHVNDIMDYDTVVYPASINLDGFPDSSYTSQSLTNQNVVEREQFISNATFRYEIVSYISSDYYYYSGEITVPKHSIDNLSQIKSINDSLFRTNNFSYSIKYNKYTATASASSVWDRGSNHVSVSNITYGADSFSGPILEGGLITDKSEHTEPLQNSLSATSSTSTTPNEPEITLSDDNENYYVSYKICVQKKVTKLGGTGRWSAAATSSVNIPLSGTLEKYLPLQLEFSIYGNKRTISFSNSTVSSNNINNSKTPAVVSESSVLTNLTKFNGYKVSDLIINNILSDYSNGIKTATVTVASMDFKDNSGNLSVDWNDGELLKVGNVVAFERQTKLDGSPILWKVTGREFDWNGEPLTTLQVMECKNYNTI